MHREPSWARSKSRSSSWGFYPELLSLILILHKAPLLYSDFSAIRRHNSVPRFNGPTQTREGVCYIFQLRDRDSSSSLSTLLYLPYVPTQTRASLSVGLPVRSFVCLYTSVCFFVSLVYSTATETQIPLLSTISCASKEPSRRSVERSPRRAWRPTTSRQSSRVCPVFAGKD